MRLGLIAALLAALTSTAPALAWDYSENADTHETWISAWQDDLDGTGAQLAVTCSDQFADESEIQFFTGLAWSSDFTTSGPETLRFQVDKSELSFAASYFEADGEAVLAVNLADDPTVQDFFEAIATAQSRIDLKVSTYSFHFGTKDVATAMQQFLDKCGSDNAL